MTDVTFAMLFVLLTARSLLRLTDGGNHSPPWRCIDALHYYNGGHRRPYLMLFVFQLALT